MLFEQREGFIRITRIALIRALFMCEMAHVSISIFSNQFNLTKLIKKIFKSFGMQPAIHFA
jgi:hypothetical protein